MKGVEGKAEITKKNPSIVQKNSIGKVCKREEYEEDERNKEDIFKSISTNKNRIESAPTYTIKINIPKKSKP